MCFLTFEKKVHNWGVIAQGEQRWVNLWSHFTDHERLGRSRHSGARAGLRTGSRRAAGGTTGTLAIHCPGVNTWKVKKNCQIFGCKHTLNMVGSRLASVNRNIIPVLLEVRWRRVEKRERRGALHTWCKMIFNNKQWQIYFMFVL